MARRKGRPSQPVRRRLSRAERERRLERGVVGGVALVLALLVLVLGFGLFQEYIAKPSSPLASVVGQFIRRRDHRDRVVYESFLLRRQLANLRLRQQQLNPKEESAELLGQLLQSQVERTERWLAQVEELVLEQMIDELLILRAAKEEGLDQVSGQEIDQEIEQRFGYVESAPPEAAPAITSTPPITPTPTPRPMTREEFERGLIAFLGQLKQETRLSEDYFRHRVEASIIRGRMEELIGRTVPVAVEQVRARHILVETMDAAEEVLRRLQAGEDFAALAWELSQDSATAQEGGDLGWFPHGRMVAPVEEAAFALQPGETSGMVTTTFGLHILRVDERAESRELEPDELAFRQAQAVDEWLLSQRKEAEIKRFTPRLVEEGGEE